MFDLVAASCVSLHAFCTKKRKSDLNYEDFKGNFLRSVLIIQIFGRLFSFVVEMIE